MSPRAYVSRSRSDNTARSAGRTRRPGRCFHPGRASTPTNTGASETNDPSRSIGNGSHSYSREYRMGSRSDRRTITFQNSKESVLAQMHQFETPHVTPETSRLLRVLVSGHVPRGQLPAAERIMATTWIRLGNSCWSRSPQPASRMHTEAGATFKGRLQGLGLPELDPEGLHVTYTGPRGESIFWGSRID